MNLFQTIKAAVTVKQAAALYGLPITTTGMTCCPFHEDHTPSMKLNDTYYYCFGCGLLLLFRLRGYRRCDRPHRMPVRSQ